MDNLYCDFTHLHYGGVKHILQDFLKDCYLRNRNVEQDFKTLHNLDPALGKVLQPLLEQALKRKNFLRSSFQTSWALSRRKNTSPKMTWEHSTPLTVFQWKSSTIFSLQKEKKEIKNWRDLHQDQEDLFFSQQHPTVFLLQEQARTKTYQIPAWIIDSRRKY